MPLKTSRATAPIATGAVLLSLAMAAPTAAESSATSTAAAESSASAAPSTTGADARSAAPLYRGEVDVVAGPDEDQDTLDGVVFDDRNKNSTQDANEKGIEGVTVSNGQDVVTTDAKGGYELPARDNMNVFVTQKAGYEVPVDEDNVAQFSYIHLPGGSPDLKYGGIEPTGELPDAVNFPMAKSAETKKPRQNCIMGGDIQTYDKDEVEYARKGAFTDLSKRSDYRGCGALFLGDVVGDDLSLYPDTRELSSMLNGPARFLPGNHDLDFDAESEHRFDTYRSQLGPDYYSYDVGDLHIVALNSVQYSTGEEYQGGLGEEQLEWLRQDIAQVPKDKKIVLATHIPLLNFHDQSSTQHQVQEVKEIHEIVSGHEAVAFGGHSHTTEVMRAGDSTEGWASAMGVEELPFDHITAGAISGDWFSGEVTPDGYPTAIQKDGARPGVLTFEARPQGDRDRFTVTGENDTEQMSVGVNTPRYRSWFHEHRENAGKAPEFENPTQVSSEDLDGPAYITANVFAGSSDSEVTVSIDGGEAKDATRTQEMAGEKKRVGALWSDPTAVMEQFVHGGSVAESGMHLWRLELPSDLEPGKHTAKVRSTDAHGRVSTDSVTFTVTE